MARIVEVQKGDVLVFSQPDSGWIGPTSELDSMFALCDRYGVKAAIYEGPPDLAYVEEQLVRNAEAFVISVGGSGGRV